MYYFYRNLTDITWELLITKSYVRIDAIIQNSSGQNMHNVNKKNNTMVWIFKVFNIVGNYLHLKHCAGINMLSIFIFPLQKKKNSLD